MTQSNDTVLVIGLFRSGTSLLSSILNQNTAVALMYECDVWNFPASLLKYRFKGNWAERIEFFNQALSRHRMVSEDDLSALKGIRTPQDLYRAYGALKGAKVSGEKSPFYCERLLQLYKEYPQAAFIFVWRNPVEVYRSVLKAGETSRFFGKPGMLSRMIYQQEQGIRQIKLLEEQGGRVFYVDYADLVDNTEKICRELCVFLDVPYDPQMLHLNKADLSAIYKSPHHAFLRRGVIERQKYDRELVSSSIVEKLERYRCRWEKMQSKWLKPSSTSSNQPGALEFVYHNIAGRLLTGYDSLVRAGFEFLPLTWLKVYRLLKNWIVNPPSGSPDEKISLWKDLHDHWITILTASGMLALIAWIHLHSNPHLVFVLFYGIPAALLALVVNARWATLFVIIASVLSPLVQYDGDPDYRSSLVFIWNFFTRFFLLEIMVLVLSRIRLEFRRLTHHVK
jgi:hypothetical protein